MAEIKILCVGSLSEPFYRDMQAEFLKRLARYARLSVVEVPDEKCRRPSDAPAAVRLRPAARRELLLQAKPLLLRRQIPPEAA